MICGTCRTAGDLGPVYVVTRKPTTKFYLALNKRKRLHDRCESKSCTCQHRVREVK